MNIEKDTIVEGRHGKPVVIDTYFPESIENGSILIFGHGFKGFKDWGHWDLIARAFVNAGFIFLKFNFSHNGTTPDQLTDFADLEAFGQNNYSKELADLDVVLNWVDKQDWANNKNIGLIGHSRGGGIGIIKSANDLRIKAFAAWASVNALDYFWKGNQPLIDEWREKGVQYVYNGRTKQNMPLYFQLYEDQQSHAEYLSIKKALKKRSDLDLLIVHGTADPAVPAAAAQQLHQWYPSSVLHLIEGADHVFGGSHPYKKDQLPNHSQELVTKSIQFFRNVL